VAFTITTVGNSSTLEGTSGQDVGALTTNISTVNAFGDDDVLTAGAATALNNSFIGMGEGDDDVTLNLATNSSEIQTGKGRDDLILGALTASTVKAGMGIDNVTITSLTSSFAATGKGADVVTIGTVGSTAANVTASSEVKLGRANDQLVVNGNVSVTSNILAGSGADSVNIVGSVITSSAVFGGEDNDTITVTGAGDNTGALYGGGGDDTITATSTTTTANNGYTFYGEAGDDTITGTSSNDTIFGGSDDDTINGGAGVDTISGGTGSNEFDFTANGTARTTVSDVITDWQSGTDNVIDYSIGLVKGTDANIDNAGFITATTFAAAVTVAQGMAGGAGASAIWNDGASTFLFIDDAAGALVDIIQMNNLVATNYTIDGNGDVVAFIA
jgi:Ca2+-binding RTX toxin-like protein